jgi:hypothetical protein
MRKTAKLDPPEPLIRGKNIHKVIIRPSVGIAFETGFLSFITFGQASLIILKLFID